MAEDGFKIADAYVEITADKSKLRDEIRKIPTDVGSDADRAGATVGKKVGDSLAKGTGDAVSAGKSKVTGAATAAMSGVAGVAAGVGADAGGKIAKGFEQSFIRNSPVIVAAVAGALSVGAPAMLSSASVLFGGIGAIAAAQSQRVQAAWVGLWDQIKSKSQQDAAVLVPVFDRMAGNIGAAFERMRPNIKRAFGDVAPQIDTFSNSIIRAAENALPGLTRAVASAGPVVEGLGAFLEKTGTGLTRFFDSISSHAPAAGQAFSSLGDIMAALLPILGELLGQGAELAAVILPPVASILGVVATALKSVGGALPAVVAGFMAMRVIGTVGSMLSGFSASLTQAAQSMAFASYQGGALGKTAGTLSTGLSAAADGTDRAARALNGMGVGLPLIGALFGLISSDISKNSEVTNRWTQGLIQGGATARGVMAEAAAESSKYRDNWVGSLMETTDKWLGLSPSIETASAAAREHIASLTPLEAAQRRVGLMQDILTEAVRKYGAESPQAAAASSAYARAQADAEREASKLELAIDGVTQAMIAQADQALAAIDAGFAYRQSVDQLEDAQAALNTAVRDHGPASEQAQRAGLALEQQNFRVASSWAQQQADLSGLERGTAKYDRLIQTETLAALTRLRDAAGPEMRGAIQQQIDALARGGVSLQNLSGQANTATGTLQNLGAQRPTPVGTLVDNITARAQWAAGSIHNIPNAKVSQAYLDDYASGRANWITQSIDRIPSYRRSQVDIVTNYINNYRDNQIAFRRAGGATGGNVGEISQGRPAKFSRGGKLEGPGGPTDDLIPARTMSGRDVLFSDDEWVIRAMSAQHYSDRLMGAINQGMATVSFGGTTVGPKGFAGGGEIGGRVGSVSTGSAASTGNVIHVGSVVLKVETPMNLMNSRDLRMAGERLREVIIGLDREQS